MAWASDHLTVEEHNAYRAAFDVGPVGTPVEDWMATGVCTGDDLPDILLPARDRLLRQGRALPRQEHDDRHDRAG